MVPSPLSTNRGIGSARPAWISPSWPVPAQLIGPLPSTQTVCPVLYGPGAGSQLARVTSMVLIPSLRVPTQSGGTVAVNLKVPPELLSAKPLPSQVMVAFFFALLPCTTALPSITSALLILIAQAVDTKATNTASTMIASVVRFIRDSSVFLGCLFICRQLFAQGSCETLLASDSCK